MSSILSLSTCDVREVRSLARTLCSVGEVVAGSRSEYSIIELIASYLDELGVSLRLEPVECLTWLEKECEVVLNDGTRVPARAIPPSPNAVVEGRCVYVGTRLRENEYSNLDVCGKIVVSDWSTHDLDDLKYQYIAAVNAGAIAFVVIEPYLDDGFRRIVVTYSGDYNFTVGEAPPIPIVVIPRVWGLKLVERLRSSSVRMCISTSVEIKHGIGYNLVVDIGGKVENEEVLVCAHHDHWFTGYCDNIVGLATLLWLVKKLIESRYTPKRSIKVVSFTAEEFGRPKFAPWYWIYGSYVYVRRHIDELVSKCIGVLCIDAFMTQPLELYVTPDYQPLVNKVLSRYSWLRYEVFPPSIYYDSLNLHVVGIGGVTVSSLDTLMKFYHTNYDTEELMSNSDLAHLLRIVADFINEMSTDYVPSVKSVEEYLRNRLKVLGLEIELHIPSLYVLKLIYREFLKPYYYGVYGEDFDKIYCDLVPEVITGSLRSEVRELLAEFSVEKLSKLRSRVVVPGSEEVLVDLPSIDVIKQLASRSRDVALHHLHYVAKYLDYLVERFQRELLSRLVKLGVEVK